MSSINSAIVMSIGFLMAAPITGFALLRSYEDFCRGVEKHNRLRMWSAFFGGSFIYVVLISSITGLVMKGPEKSISGYLLTIGLAFPLISALAGFPLLKAYEILQNGVQKKSRMRVWLAFFIGSAVFIFITFTAIKLVIA